MPSAARTADLTPLYAAAVLFYLLLLPEQFYLRIGGILFPPYRFFLLPAVLFITFSGLRGGYRFAWTDALVLCVSLWIWVAAFVTSGSLATGSIQFGSHFVDITLAYFIMRISIRSMRDLRLFLVMIAPGVIFTSVLVIQESLTHTRIYQRVAADLTGAPYRLRDDLRLGLMRGTGPFPHPILAGIFLASFLPLYGLSGIRGWPRTWGLIASVGGFFTMSSAALLGILAGIALWFYDWLTEQIANLKWRLFLLAMSVVYVVVESTSNTGFFGLLVRYASFNTATAYNRVLIWEYGTENVARNPWFGIGYGEWDRPDFMNSGSMDHFWLVMAVRFGLPVAVMLALATTVAVLLLAIRAGRLPPADARLARGVAISLAVFALGAISVSLWLSALVWFSMLMGIAVSLGKIAAEPAGPMSRGPASPRPGAPRQVRPGGQPPIRQGQQHNRPEGR